MQVSCHLFLYMGTFFALLLSSVQWVNFLRKYKSKSHLNCGKAKDYSWLEACHFFGIGPDLPSPLALLQILLLGV